MIKAKFSISCKAFHCAHRQHTSEGAVHGLGASSRVQSSPLGPEPGKKSAHQHGPCQSTGLPADTGGVAIEIFF